MQHCASSRRWRENSVFGTLAVLFGGSAFLILRLIGGPVFLATGGAVRIDRCRFLPLLILGLKPSKRRPTRRRFKAAKGRYPPIP